MRMCFPFLLFVIKTNSCLFGYKEICSINVPQNIVCIEDFFQPVVPRKIEILAFEDISNSSGTVYAP